MNTYKYVFTIHIGVSCPLAWVYLIIFDEKFRKPLWIIVAPGQRTYWKSVVGQQNLFLCPVSPTPSLCLQHTKRKKNYVPLWWLGTLLRISPKYPREFYKACFFLYSCCVVFSGVSQSRRGSDGSSVGPVFDEEDELREPLYWSNFPEPAGPEQSIAEPPHWENRFASGWSLRPLTPPGW